MSRTLFPEGVMYDTENHRYLTKNVNSYFGLINTLSTSYKENKKGINQSNTDLSPFVARPGWPTASASHNKFALSKAFQLNASRSVSFFHSRQLIQASL